MEVYLLEKEKIITNFYFSNANIMAPGFLEPSQMYLKHKCQIPCFNSFKQN